MITLCRTYPDERAARRAAEDLARAGVPEHDIQVMSGSRPHDVRREPVGQFAGMLAPDAPVGTFGGATRLRRQGRGAFAGRPDDQRVGSFGDVDREVVITRDAGREHARIADQRGLWRVLRALAVDDDTRETVLHELGSGHATVLVELAEIAPDQARARLAEPAPAATG
jgi:hypothetical protein